MAAKFENTHRKIIDGGMEVMLEHGFYNASVNMICKASGVTRPTFYSHFDSKENIIGEYYDLSCPFSEETKKWISSTFTDLERIFRLLAAYLQNAGDIRHVELFSKYLVYKLSSQKYGSNAIYTKSFDNEIRSLLVSFLRGAQDHGEIQNTSAAAYLCDSIMALQLGFLFRWCASEGNYNRNKNMFQSLEALLMIRPDLRESWEQYCSLRVPGFNIPKELP